MDEDADEDIDDEELLSREEEEETSPPQEASIDRAMANIANFFIFMFFKREIPLFFPSRQFYNQKRISTTALQGFFPIMGNALQGSSWRASFIIVVTSYSSLEDLLFIMK